MYQVKFIRVLLVLILVLPTAPAFSAGVVVYNQDEYHEAVKNAGPGDVIRLANGTWKDFEIVFTGKGLPDAPVTLTAENKGEVIITGQSNLRLAGEHLVVSVLVFKNGYTPTKEVIAFRRNKEHVANHSRVTEVVIDHFNNPERTESDYWVSMYGRYNRFDHNHLEGKNNNGVTMAVHLSDKNSQQNHHRIDYNYFGPRPILGSNGGETLRIGTSHYSLTDSHTVVENNYFDRCNGEVEIISNKSGRNVFRGNVFFESRGTLTLRHGNDNLVENNVFFGNGVDHTGGIRLINKRQTIRNNYMLGLTGSRFGSALTIMNGVPNSPINRYHQVEDSRVENNTVIDARHIEMAAGSDDERSAVPKTTQFRNNLVYNADGHDPFTIHDDISGITFEGNVQNNIPGFQIKEGFSTRDVTLEHKANGLIVPGGKKLKGVGAAGDLDVLEKASTGVSWYPKADKASRFDGGQVHKITVNGDQLSKAVAKAGAGDVLELSPGHYLVERFIRIDKPLTIRAAEGKPTIEFERTALFEILDGGALKLENLSLSGRSAPDVAGNSLIRTSRYSMLTNYELIVNNCEVSNLDVNHSFNFLTVSKSTFAKRIEINNSTFSNITGAILALDKETDDLGLYNAEYVVITDSIFKDIGKALLNIYRGGTDESTFGPHVKIRGTDLISVGNNKRNKRAASIFMLGVQNGSISGNEFRDSQPVRIMQTVGEFNTRIEDNRFIATPAPDVIRGPVVVSGNTITEGGK